jgi:hypothetical protein
MRITQTLRKRRSDVLSLMKIFSKKSITLIGSLKSCRSTFSILKDVVKFDMHSYPNLLGKISMGSEDESKTIQKSWLFLSRVHQLATI